MDEKPFSAAMHACSRSEIIQDPNLLQNGGFFMSEPESVTQSAQRRSAAVRRKTTKAVVILAMLTAMEVVLNRFASINTWNLKIGLSFIPVVLGAMLYGPLGGAVVAGLGDLVGALLFPIGPYFPGFTATALLTGLVFGFFLQKSQKPLGVVLSVAINQLILSLLLNSFWISVLYGSPYFPLLGTRLLQCAVLIPVQIVLILALAPALRRLKTEL